MYYDFGLIFVVWICIGYNNIVLTKVSAKNWEHSDVATTKFSRARNMSCQTN